MFKYYGWQIKIIENNFENNFGMMVKTLMTNYFRKKDLKASTFQPFIFQNANVSVSFTMNFLNAS